MPLTQLKKNKSFKAEPREKVKKLQGDLRNAKDQDRRHKKTVKSLQEDLKQRNCSVSLASILVTALKCLLTHNSR